MVDLPILKPTSSWPLVWDLLPPSVVKMSSEVLSCTNYVWCTWICPAIMQVVIMGLDVVVRKKLLPKFLFQLLLSLNLGFSFPQSLNLQLLPPRSCLTSQTSCCQFNFHGFWHIIANKDLLNLVKPIHKLLVIQATICRYLILYPLWA